MNVLIIEPFLGGSHQAFLEGWRRHSRHALTVLGLPAYKWKWRMRHAAVAIASRLREPPWREQSWDVVWCSDMLNLAEFLGLAPPEVANLPRVVYFHENQLTYPVRQPDARDLHFAFTNFTSALAANAVWFNSAFHRDQFLRSLRDYLTRMPDFVPLAELNALAEKTCVQYPGTPSFPNRVGREAGPLRILWNARWEHDKNPRDFFAALRRLSSLGMPFRLLMLGESFRECPADIPQAREDLASHIEHWGYAPTVEQYRGLLGRADVVVSTAHHEFFGIGVIEAMAAGVVPRLPNRLSYPELLAAMHLPAHDYLYDGSVDQLVRRLAESAAAVETAAWTELATRTQHAAAVFSWPRRAEEMDAQLESCV